MKKKLMLFSILLLFNLILVNAAKAKLVTISASWDANAESDIAGYRIYVAQTYASVVNGTKIEMGNKTSGCFQIDDSYPIYFFGLTAYDTEGLESAPTIGYILFGNISGTYNDGTPYTSARVDGFDLTTLGLNFGKFVTHPIYNCSEIFTIQPPTDAQKCDLNGDGRIDGFDLIEFGFRFGNAASQ